MLLGVIITGLFVAVSMTAEVVLGIMQKNILKMEIRVEKAQKLKAAVTGDTVGDPYKDVAGPAVTNDKNHKHVFILLAVIAG